ncbi:MAG: bacteriocin family protein [Armatimonadetes bacterium]|nr:bacteriocin family protein [Armatimonadota bacterium]
MASYLGRDAAPLSEEQWEQLEEVVVNTARNLLVGRRVLPLFGPLGAGVTAVPTVQIGPEGPKSVLVELCENGEDFAIDWRQLEQAKVLGAMDWSAAAMAAAKCATREDQEVFLGCQACGTPGLLNVPGRLEVKGGDWSDGEALFSDVVAATTKLAEAGFPGPYALVASPQTLALTHRWTPQGADLEDMIEELAAAGLFSSRHVPEKTLLVMQVGAHVADLAVGVDLTIAYIGNDGMTHLFRVLETGALRIKQPAGICVVTGK